MLGGDRGCVRADHVRHLSGPYRGGVHLLDDAVEKVPLAGGTNHSGWLVTRPDGSRVAVKTTENLPADVFETEAEGLLALRDSGAVAAPAVLEVGPDYLVLEGLDPAPDHDDARFWEEAGRALARLHSIRGERFGWHHDNWLGLVRQVNTWAEDCYEFFTQHRVLRYLPEPAVAAVLDRADRAAVERICAKLPELVPPSYPALTHGDLWWGNVMATAAGRPALIDPAVSWSWPEVDISMMSCADPAPECFFSAYHEILPPEPGWQERMRLLHLRELLSVIAHGRPDWDEWAVPATRELLLRYG